LTTTDPTCVLCCYICAIVGFILSHLSPIVYTSCPDCLLCSHYHIFDLNIPYCICPHPRDATT